MRFQEKAIELKQAIEVTYGNIYTDEIKFAQGPLSAIMRCETRGTTRLPPGFTSRSKYKKGDGILFTLPK